MNTKITLLLLCMVSLLSLVSGGGMMDKPRKMYTGYKLLRVANVASEYQDVLIQTLEHRDTVQLWRLPKVNNSVEILVGQSRYEDVIEFLKEIELSAEIIQPDISILLNEEREKYFSPSGSPLSFDSYHDYDDIVTYFLRRAGRRNPKSQVELSSEIIGTTPQGRSIYLFKVTKHLNGDHFPVSLLRESYPEWVVAKPSIWIDAGLHGRDWLAIGASTYILDQLLSGKYDRLLEEYDFYILPTINPDGYHFTRTMDRFWAKNLGGNGPNSRGCEGVNLDRNFAFMYRGELIEKYSRGTGLAHYQCSDYYGGNHTQIEPEVTALSRAVWVRRERITLYLSLQGYSQTWLLPRESSKDNDFDKLSKLAEVGNEALEANSGVKYFISTWEYSQAEPPGKCVDWMKQIAGIRYSYGVKLRDDGRSRAYLVPATEIRTVGDEILAAVSAMSLVKSEH